MSAAKHTPMPWIGVPQSDGSTMIAHEFQTGQQMKPKGLRLIAHVLARGNSLQQDEANAARILACVKACEGTSNEELEAAERAYGMPALDALKGATILVTQQRDELLSLLKDTTEALCAAGPNGISQLIARNRAAIAKVQS